MTVDLSQVKVACDSSTGLLVSSLSVGCKQCTINKHGDELGAKQNRLQEGKERSVCNDSFSRTLASE